jgi:hypothetical protein
MELTVCRSWLFAPIHIGFLAILLAHCALAADPLQFTGFPRSASVGKTYTLTWSGGDGSVRTSFSPTRDVLIRLLANRYCFEKRTKFRSDHS